MIDALDLILKRLLTDALSEAFDPPTTLLPVTPVAVSFDAPDDEFRKKLALSTTSILNVYLADVRENRKLRSNDRFAYNGTVPSESQAPARLDCHYLVSAWSPGQDLQDQENVVSEHRLLYSAAASLLRHNPIVARHVFGDVPADLDSLNDDPASDWHATVALNDPTLKDFYSLDPVIRDLELPSDVMPPEGFHRVGEFWGLMGAGAVWHPSAYVIVTLPVERLRRSAGPPVRSIGTTYDRTVPTATRETLFLLGGTVSRPTGRPVPRTRVTLTRVTTDPATGAAREFVETTETDGQGRFVFGNLPAGPVDLQAGRAAKLPVNVPPRSPGEYDLTVP